MNNPLTTLAEAFGQLASKKFGALAIYALVYAAIAKAVVTKWEPGIGVSGNVPFYTLALFTFAFLIYIGIQAGLDFYKMRKQDVILD